MYEGIFHTAIPEGKELSVVLHWAKPLQGPAAAQAKPAVKQLTIPSADLVQIVARDVDMTPEGLSGASLNGAGAFETDSEISRGRGGCALP